MLQVVEINYIRHEVNQKGKSYAEVARQVRRNERTVKKYADQEEFPQKYKQTRTSPAMDPVKHILDGGDRTVRRYVSEHRKELSKEAEGASLPLETISGTAQVDFGKAPFKYLNEVIELDEFNQTLWEKAENNRQWKHYIKKELLELLHEQTCAAHILLPEKLFNFARIVLAKADKCGIVHIDNKLYSTSPRFAQKNVVAEVTYNEVRILDETHTCIVTHSRLYGSKAKSMVWQLYLKLLSQRPRPIKYSGVYDHLPEAWSAYLKACTEEEQKAAFSLLAELMKELVDANQIGQLAKLMGQIEKLDLLILDEMGYIPLGKEGAEL